MKNRNPIAVFLLSTVTLGIYSWYWYVKTKGEMNKLGEKIPTAWIWLIPIIGSFWWYWEYSKAVDHITHQELNWVITLLVSLLLGGIGQAIIQDYFNKIDINNVGNPMPTNTPSTPPMSPPVNNPPNLTPTPASNNEQLPATNFSAGDISTNVPAPGNFTQSSPDSVPLAPTVDPVSNLNPTIPAIETPVPNETPDNSTPPSQSNSGTV